MTQASTQYKANGPTSVTELADLLTGAEAQVVQHLPDLWPDLTPQQQAEIAEIARQLEVGLRQLSAVTEQARRQAQIRRNQGAIALLDSWADGDAADAAEQQETWEYLKRVLDEDRLSDRPLFP